MIYPTKHLTFTQILAGGPPRPLCKAKLAYMRPVGYPTPPVIRNLTQIPKSSFPYSFLKSLNSEKCGPKKLAPVVPEKSKI